MGKEPPHDPAPDAAALPIRSVTKMAAHISGMDGGIRRDDPHENKAPPGENT